MSNWLIFEKVISKSKCGRYLDTV